MLTDAIAAIKRAKALPVWDAIDPALRVVLDAVFRAIEAEVLQAQEPVAWRDHPAAIDSKAIATAQEIALMWGHDRSQFVSRIQVAVTEAMMWIRNAAPQPPAPCPKCAELQTQIGKDALDSLAAEYQYQEQVDALQAKVAEQSAELESAKSPNAGKWERRYEEVLDQNNALKQKIEEHAALIERCEKALASAVEWGAPMRDAPKSSRPYWFGDSVTALAAIAAHKKAAE